ncbi:hypothetical protein ACVGXB_00040, partial [Enterobacter intestinihominis]
MARPPSRASSPRLEWWGSRGRHPNKKNRALKPTKQTLNILKKNPLKSNPSVNYHNMNKKKTHKKNKKKKNTTPKTR